MAISYSEFIHNKSLKTEYFGIEITNDDINSIAFDYQKDIIRWALKKGKAGVFADCGLGKTLISSEWARIICERTGRNVLMVAPLGVTSQTVDECKRLQNLDINTCRSQDDVKQGINITNYEILDKFDTSSFVGVVLDESSILKNFVGKTKTKLVDDFKNTPYKLSLTATPAPNDYLELLNQADFLDVMSAGNALGTWFINDMKTGEWRLKGHAVKAFWEWVSSWAVLVDKPSDLGYSDDGFILPKHNEITVELEIDLIDPEYKDGLIRNIELSATSYHKEKHFTAELRSQKTAAIVEEHQGEQFIIWCDTNEEADILKRLLPYAKEVRGSDKPKWKEEAAMQFKRGEIQVLISKPKIFGYGMNFQNCHNAIFNGRTFSYEDYYQGVKRLVRFGQKHEVTTYTVIGSTERQILEIVKNKQQKQLEMKKNINNCIKDIQLSNFTGRTTTTTDKMINIDVPQWIRSEEHYELYNEECGDI